MRARHANSRSPLCGYHDNEAPCAASRKSANSLRINTSKKSSFFRISLKNIDLKPFRISKCDNKSIIINTSGNYRCRSF